MTTQHEHALRKAADKLRFNLDGKDYFTTQEAAHYACVSTSGFRVKAPRLGLKPFKFMGRFVYRRTDLQKAMEAEAKAQKIRAGRNRSV